jgi:peptidoglycan/LPS O-acetylase OafA/YrhL
MESPSFWKKESMLPSSRNQTLDIFRILATLSVFIFHYNQSTHAPWLAWFRRFGWEAGEFFFVLSGFLIASQLLKPVSQGLPIPIKKFLLRRALRIWPSFYVVGALYYWLPGFSEGGGLVPPWRLFSFTQNIGLQYNHEPAFTQAWTLCVEEHFYLLLPLILLVFMKFGTEFRVKLLIAGLVLFGVLIRFFLWMEFVQTLKWPESSVRFFELIYYPTWAQLDGLIIGTTLATIYRMRPALWSRLTSYGNVSLFGSISLFSLSLFLFKDTFAKEGPSFTYPFASIAYLILALNCGLLLLSSLSSNGVMRHRPKIPGLEIISVATYSFYLVHKAMIYHAHQLLRTWHVNSHGATAFLFTLALAISASAVLYLFVEAPFLKVRRYYRL